MRYPHGVNLIFNTLWDVENIGNYLVNYFVWKNIYFFIHIKMLFKGFIFEWIMNAFLNKYLVFAAIRAILNKKLCI